ncbi:RNA-binding protein 12 [Argonauta hians]
MSVIIRLQGLPWSASAMDIRQYFQGLSIPDGGVHIVGGERGDAFIAFGSDEDARQAMLRTNGKINGNTVQLLLSSKTEMQNVIAMAREAVPVQAFNKPTSSAAPPSTGAPSGPPPTSQPPAAATPMAPQNHANFLPDRSVPPPRNMDYPNRNFPPVPADIRSNLPPSTNNIGPGLPPMPGIPPASNIVNPSNMNRDPYFSSQDQDSNKINRPPMDYRPPGDTPADFPMNRRPNFPPNNPDPRMEHGANDQRHFGGANMNAPSGGFMNMRDPHLNLPNFPGPNPNQNRNIPMPNAPLQPGDMMAPGKPPGPDGMPPYHTDRKNDFDANQQGNMRPNMPPVHPHMPPANINRPDFPPHRPPRMDMGPPIQRGGPDMLNQPNPPRPNDSNNANPEPHGTMNYMRNEPARADMPSRPDPGRTNVSHPEPNLGRTEPNRGDVGGRREPPKPDGGRHEPGSRSYGGRHESRFDSPRSEGTRPDHVRTDQERAESIRLETGRLAATRSESNRPGSSGRSDMSKSDPNRPDSSRGDSSKSVESGRHESSRTDSNRSDSGRHDSKSDSGRHDSRSESGRHEFNRYDSGRHDSRHDRSRDDGGRYDRHDRGRDDSRYDRRDSRRDSRYDSHYDSGRHDRYNQHDSGGRYDSARNDSRHEGGRGGDKGPPNRGPVGSRDIDRGGRDSQGKMDSGGSNRRPSPPGDTYKNPGPGDLGNRKGRMDMAGNMNRNNRSKSNEYIGDNRRDYGYGQPPSRDQGFPGSMSGFEGQRFPERPLGPPDCPPFGEPNMGDDPHMMGKDKMYEDSDMSGLPRGLLGDAPPGFLPGQSGPPHDSHPNWDDDGYRRRDDQRPDDRIDDFRGDWRDEEMNRGPHFSQGGSWNDMPPNQPPYHHNDGPPPFPHNEPFGRYDNMNRNERGGPPGRMSGSNMDDRKYGPPNDMNFGGGGGGGGGGDPGNRRPGDMDDNSMRGMKRGHCDPDLYVEVVGLPFSVGYRDVRRFFAGCTIPRDGLKLINNEKGRRAGNAFVRFASEQDTAEAFSRHGNYMANRYIEIYRCLKEHFDNAVDSFVPKAGNYPPPNKMMKMDYPSENISRDPRESREPPGPKPNDIPPFAKSNKETSSSTAENSNNNNNPLNSSSSSSSTSPVIQIKGIPLNATNDDIVKFLKDVHISNPATCVVIEHDSRGKNTGIAYVEVMSQKDYETSLTYDGRHMGGRLIRIVEGSRKDMSSLVDKEKKGLSEKSSPSKNAKDVSKSMSKTDSKPGSCDKTDNVGSKPPEAKDEDKKGIPGGNGRKNETLTTHPVPYYCVSLKGLPFAVTTNEIKEFFQGLNIAPRGIQIVYGKDGRTTGQAFVEFVTSMDCEKAVARDKRYVGKRYINVVAVTKAEMTDCLKQARLATLQNNVDPPNPPPFMVHGGKQYEYVRGENFPPTVSIGEILNFFRGYFPIPESIRLHYADDGRPTGNAMIGFLTRDEAIKALEDLNHKICRKNIVMLRKA